MIQVRNSLIIQLEELNGALKAYCNSTEHILNEGKESIMWVNFMK